MTVPTDRASPPKPTGWPGQVTWAYSTAELWADGVIHILGVTIAILGSIAFAVMAPKGSVAEMLAMGTYLATLIFLLATSAAYNIWPVSRFKWILRRLDHSAIYCLIAGTYTPLMVKIGSWWLLWVVWTVALIGVALKIFQPGRFDRWSIALYLALGWSGISIYDRLLSALSPTALWLIGLGGLTYSLGVVFHVWERLRFQNAIWHGFVLIAASIHYAAVWVAMSDTANASPLQ